MGKITFRDLRADEIECRVGTVKEGKGLSLLLYKDARCDMNILDETLGAENWQRDHFEVKGNMYCRVFVNINYDVPDKPAAWVFKADCGTESNTEAEKGEASDSFKRACVNWGIGRELYTAPFIWVPEAGGGKYDKYEVDEIRIESKTIVALTVVNTKTGKPVFSWDLKKEVVEQCKPKHTTQKPQAKLGDDILMECESLKINLSNVAVFLGKTVDALTEAEVRECIEKKKAQIAAKNAKNGQNGTAQDRIGAN